MAAPANRPQQRRAELLAVRTGRPHAPGRKPKAQLTQPARKPRFHDSTPRATSGAVMVPPAPAGVLDDAALADIIKRDGHLSLNRCRVTQEVYALRQDETVRVLEQFLSGGIICRQVNSGSSGAREKKP